MSQLCITNAMWGESTGDWKISLTKGQYYRKRFYGMMWSWVHGYHLKVSKDVNMEM